VSNVDISRTHGIASVVGVTAQPLQEAVADLPPTLQHSRPGILLFGLRILPDSRRHPYTLHPSRLHRRSVDWIYPEYGRLRGTAFVFSDLLGNHQLAVAEMLRAIERRECLVGYGQF